MTKLSNQVAGLANRQQNIAAQYQADADKLNAQSGNIQTRAERLQARADAQAGKSEGVSQQSADLFEWGNQVGGLAGQAMMDKSQDMAEVAANMMGRSQANAGRSAELGAVADDKSSEAGQAQTKANLHSARAERLHRVSEGLLAQGLKV